jgi:NAD-dependent SIR2 family protein deacetylase
MPSPTTNGPINAVRCPHCGKNNDFRDMQSQQLLDTGAIADCDHCGRHMEVVSIRPVVVVTVRAASANAQVTRIRQGGPAPRQATTLSPAAVKKLLRGR